MSAQSWRHYTNLIVLLGVFGVVVGCVGSPSGHEAYRKEGFQITLPSPGTRVVVRGNDAEAVSQTLHWLNGHQLLVVNRRVEQGMTAQEFARQNGEERQAQVRAVTHQVGATLMVFVHVDATPADPVSVGSQPQNMVVVNVQGVDAQTGEVAFESKAWNAEPLPASERLVPDLTVLALEKAWQKESAASRSGQQKLTSENTTEHQVIQIAPVPGDSGTPPTTRPATVPSEPSDSLAVAQSVPVESSATPRKQVTVFMKPVSEETSPVPVVTEPMVAENSETSDDPSLGLQVASGALSILYTPFKVVYAGLGGLFGGFAYLLTAGNEQVAQSVWDASLKGTYWITPDHLQGNEPVRFKGEVTP